MGCLGIFAVFIASTWLLAQFGLADWVLYFWFFIPGLFALIGWYRN